MNISDLKTRLAGKIHGQTLNKVQDVGGLIYEAAGNVLLRIDPKETMRTTVLTNGLYDQVYDYTAPTDLKGDKIVDITSQSLENQTPNNNFNQVYGKEFSLYKDGNTVSTRMNSGVKTLNISKSLTAGTTVSTTNSLTDNGTWSATGNAINLIADTVNKVSGGGSLKFDISASGTTAGIENSTLTAVDLSTYLYAGSLFAYVYIPSTTIITSVTLRWGSSSANYFSSTATTTQENTAFIVGWNLIRFDYATASETGTVINTAIDYLRVTFNYNGTATTSCRVDNIVARLPSPYTITYYSKYLFKNTAGTWIESPTAIDDSDTINLDVESYNILLYETAYLIAQQLGGEDTQIDVDYFKRKRDEVWSTYLQSNKTVALKPRASYYRLFNRR